MQKSAPVFDIAKFSIHDGPGIRTTVFLKGCPLRCVWCHNPESWKAFSEILYDPGKCLNCGACVKACSIGSHTLVEGKHSFERLKCQACGKCAECCPTEALKLCGELKSPEEVFSEVVKDKVFYRNSSGGMTISGGEPMAHFEFTLALLKMAKKEQIHTTLDTCGFAAQKQYAAVLPFTDLFLFDIKTMDQVKHKKFTGQNHELILKNLYFLNDSEAKIILRCPLIPSLNDSDTELAAIGTLAQSLDRVAEVQVLPYHPLGVGKAAHLGCATIWNAPFATEEYIRHRIARIAAHTVKPVGKG